MLLWALNTCGRDCASIFDRSCPALCSTNHACLCRLHTQDDDGTAVTRAVAKLGGLPSSHRVLLLLDNVEDCLQGESAVSFGQLIIKVRASTQHW